MRTQRVLGLVLSVIAIQGTASAQEAGDAGLVMGFPASFGLVWHATDRVALRPALTLGGASSETSGGDFSLSTSDSWRVGLSVGALFYLGTDDRLRTYVAPAFTYSHANNSSEIRTVFNEATSFDNTSDIGSDAYGVSGSFGAQYGFSDRFNVFGEVGIEYDRSTGSYDGAFTEVEVRTHSWGTRGAVGVVLYF